MAIEGIETRGDLQRFVADALRGSSQATVARQMQSRISSGRKSIELMGATLPAATPAAAQILTPQPTVAPIALSAAGGAGGALWLDPTEHEGAQRIRWAYHVGATGPGVAVTLGLYPVTSFTNTSISALGAVVVSSVIAAPAANSHDHVDTADFVLPAAGWYAMAATPGGATAAGSSILVSGHMTQRAA